MPATRSAYSRDGALDARRERPRRERPRRRGRPARRRRRPRRLARRRGSALDLGVDQLLREAAAPDLAASRAGARPSSRVPARPAGAWNQLSVDACPVPSPSTAWSTRRGPRRTPASATSTSPAKVARTPTWSVADPREPRAVVVAERQVVEQILDRREAEARERGRALRPDSPAATPSGRASAARRSSGARERRRARASAAAQRAPAPRRDGVVRRRPRAVAPRAVERARAASGGIASPARAQRAPSARVASRSRTRSRPARSRRAAANAQRPRSAASSAAREAGSRPQLPSARRHRCAGGSPAAARTPIEPSRVARIAPAAARSAASVVKYGTRALSAVRRSGNESRAALRVRGAVLMTRATSPALDALHDVGRPSRTFGTRLDREAQAPQVRAPCPASRRARKPPATSARIASPSRAAVLARGSETSARPPVGSGFPAAICAFAKARAEVGVDAHHLAGGLHLRAEHRVDAGELDEREDRLLHARSAAGTISSREARARRASRPPSRARRASRAARRSPSRRTAPCARRAGSPRGRRRRASLTANCTFIRPSTPSSSASAGVLARRSRRCTSRGERVRRQRAGAVAGVDAGLLDVLHDAADDDARRRR